MRTDLVFFELTIQVERRCSIQRQQPAATGIRLACVSKVFDNSSNDYTDPGVLVLSKGSAAHSLADDRVGADRMCYRQNVVHGMKESLALKGEGQV